MIDDNHTASELGFNPYAPGEIGAYDQDSRVGGDPRSEGLNGATLDDLCRLRWVEGRRVGAEEGRAEAARRYAPIFDDGFARGRLYGSTEASRRYIGLFGDSFRQILNDLDDIEAITTSDGIKERTQRGIGLLREIVRSLQEERDGQQAPFAMGQRA